MSEFVKLNVEFSSKEDAEKAYLFLNEKDEKSKQMIWRNGHLFVGNGESFDDFDVFEGVDL